MFPLADLPHRHLFTGPSSPFSRAEMSPLACGRRCLLAFDSVLLPLTSFRILAKFSEFSAGCDLGPRAPKILNQNTPKTL